MELTNLIPSKVSTHNDLTTSHIVLLPKGATTSQYYHTKSHASNIWTLGGQTQHNQAMACSPIDSST